ncbi:type II restriction endonuclease BsuBI [Bradyrhizobium sp. SSBR45G]|uniref:BsuBI/PstI family type II restriction endonuclease n=1 Tax=unclassified Bradyrhizobium TaxID=2631580 RepID=UPI00234298F5|nr:MULTISPECIES: BsuBI/PstI family type II restriction endonuclease [unclassified Bradyrhizobium]GLH79768.1 type II restriction endonuclease BsuBI [Bradyrhizobium sp. SSBR45G]GLH87114.1 type II restriction endonuclease BsuBI [Bradyrhizobium sp. SSBR45R]
MSKQKLIDEALQILADLGLPPAQRNERSALTLLALVDLRPDGKWSELKEPLMGVTPIMEWIGKHYDKVYAPNTRETIRRQTLHQFVDAGIALYNPDDPLRSVNSPKAVYQIAPDCKALLQTQGTGKWDAKLLAYLEQWQTLADRYAREREMNMIPVKIPGGKELKLSPGEHSELIRDIIEQFAPRFAPGSVLVYAGDTGEKMGFFDEDLLRSLGVTVDNHGKMPDVILFWKERNWLLLVESVTSHGPVDGKRHEELAKLFAKSTAGLVYATAFPSRTTMAKYLPDIAWETEVWTADAPTHLIHFNGDRFLGPHSAAPPAAS